MTLRVLHLEDDPNDRELVQATLESEQIECQLVQVASRDAFEQALAETPDLILADYSLPGFNGEHAQEIAREKCPDVPFVFVTGSIGEEEAVERLKSGATDYVLKDRLDKLPTAVRRALREAEDRRERAAAEAALRRLNVELEQRVAERTRALIEANESLEQARRAADRANQAKSEFLSRMSHDLRTPLNAIMGFAELMEYDPLTAEQKTYVENILGASRHLLNLINESLDIARIEAGRLTLSLEPVTVAEVLAPAATLIQPLASRRGIRVELRVPEDLRVVADRHRLNQVMLNLLANAVKYNVEEGSVFVEGECRGGTVVIEVVDTGVGIAEDKLARLFTPFERLGAESSTVEGTGLGLAVSKLLVEAMHGSLTAHSEPHTGTTFRLELPAARDAASTPGGED